MVKPQTCNIVKNLSFSLIVLAQSISIFTYKILFEIKKVFFVYPNDKPYTVLDLDDLTDETYLVACVYQNNKPKIFLFQQLFLNIFRVDY